MVLCRAFSWLFDAENNLLDQLVISLGQEMNGWICNQEPPHGSALEDGIETSKYIFISKFTTIYQQYTWRGSARR